MRRGMQILFIGIVSIFLAHCATSYKAKPLPFKSPSSYPNATEVAGAIVGAEAFVDPRRAKEAFGFDIRGAGMLPVQVVFDNQGSHSLEINTSQTFLEDEEGNLWPILASETAYERASKYARTKQIFKEGAYDGFLGAAAGAVIGAAIGIVTGDNVAGTAGKGAAVGAAAGATIGGIKGYTSNDARRSVINDLRQKSLQNRAVGPNDLTFGFLFFPGEAYTARQLRLQLVESDSLAIHVIKLDF
ncbi:MAG: hypothetical protein JRJ02_00435 [Deltaproteobacteria bacterium]|nr:hypothetical protein [Deltaproteobacteria bacterium]